MGEPRPSGRRFVRMVAGRRCRSRPERPRNHHHRHAHQYRPRRRLADLHPGEPPSERTGRCRRILRSRARPNHKHHSTSQQGRPTALFHRRRCPERTQRPSEHSRKNRKWTNARTQPISRHNRTNVNYVSDQWYANCCCRREAGGGSRRSSCCFCCWASSRARSSSVR